MKYYVRCAIDSVHIKRSVKIYGGANYGIADY